MIRFIVLSILLVATFSAHAFEFNISEDGSTLLKDGHPTRVISGSFHYFRVPSAEWPQRFATLAASGLNTIQTYIAWNFHCPSETEPCSFDGDRNISHFFDLAHQHGLQVMLRPGPFICAEWDFGGFPAWMLPTVGVPALRTSDPLYMQYVAKWWGLVLQIVKPHLYVVSGGPIVMVQVENEYGTFGNDTVYLSALRDLLRENLGPNVLLYSTDADHKTNIANTAIEGVYQVIDFFYYGWWNNNVAEAWENQHSASSKNRNLTRGPNFNDEFYPGWYTSWFDSSVANHTVEYVVNLTSVILNTAVSGASNLNFYMFFGGTNFGYWPGYRVTTSYDYGAPMNESGHVTPMYTALAPILRAASGMAPVANISQPPPLVSYGTATFTDYISLWDTRVLEWLASKVVYVGAQSPLPSMEALGLSAGMLMYEFQIRQNVTSLTLMGVNDYAVVVCDGVVVGHLINWINETIALPQSTYVDTVWILMDHDGRQKMWSAGTPSAFVAKGIGAAGVIINGEFTPPNGYTIYGLPMSWEKLMFAAPWLKLKASSTVIPAGAAFQATFNVTAPVGAGSLLDVSNMFASDQNFFFGRGQAYLNGHGLGRYWTAAGPQKRLYVPYSFLCTGSCTNTLIVVEIGNSIVASQSTVAFRT